MARLTLPFDCPACQAETGAEVSGLSDPAQYVDAKTRAILGAAGAADLEQSILRQQAQRTLRYATCPRCGAQNPEGLAHQARERWYNRLIAAGLGTALAVWAFFSPRVALVVPGLSVLLTLVMLVHRRREGLSTPWKVLAARFAIGAALTALVILVPRAAFVVPLLSIVDGMRSKQPEEDRAWAEAARAIRFET